MGNSPYTTLILIVVMVVAFYFLILRPNRKRQQAQQKALSALAPGTRVMTGSGLFGTILSIGDKQAVLELSPGVEVTVLKQAIARPARPEDEDSVMNDDPDEVDEPVETDEPLDETTEPYASDSTYSDTSYSDTGYSDTGYSNTSHSDSTHTDAQRRDDDRELGSPFDRPSATSPQTSPRDSKREDS